MDVNLLVGKERNVVAFRVGRRVSGDDCGSICDVIERLWQRTKSELKRILIIYGRIA